MKETQTAQTITSNSPTPARSKAAEDPVSAVETARTIVDVDRVDFCYRSSPALQGITLKIPEKRVTAFVGPSGCGKSTLLRCFNRMNDLIDHTHITAGEIRIDGVNINGSKVDVTELIERSSGETFFTYCSSSGYVILYFSRSAEALLKVSSAVSMLARCFFTKSSILSEVFFLAGDILVFFMN
jgi:energy-coupling factor transporter ATP-binding protein EcfA2